MKSRDIITRILLAVLFIFSGLIKIYPIEFFENELLFNNLCNTHLVPYVSRALISAEIFLGAVLLFTIWDKWALRLSFLMMVIYTVWLIWLLVIEGNSVNCGCFGQAINLTPIEGIIKNILLVGLLVLFSIYRKEYNLRFQKLILSVLLVSSIALPYVLAPVFFSSPTVYDSGGRTAINFNEIGLSKIDALNLGSGKKVIAFFLSECEHCRLAARRLEAIKRENIHMPIYGVLYSKSDEQTADFLKASTIKFPHYVVTELAPLIKGISQDYPVIFYSNNGFIETRMTMYDLDEEDIKLWLEAGQ